MQADQVLERSASAHREAGDRPAPPPDKAFVRPAQAAKPRAVQLFVHHDLAELEREWRRFEQIAHCTPFQSFNWLSAWQRHVGVRTNTRPAIVIGRSESNELLFILPLATRKAGLQTELTFLGSDLCDYNAPLLGPGFAAAVSGDFPSLWNDIRRMLQKDPQHFHDLTLLEKMPGMIGYVPNPFTELALTLNPSGAYATTLSGDWETFYADKRSSSTRRRDRTKRKKLAENGEVRMVTPEEPREVAATLAVLLEQKQKAFARMGVPNIFEKAGYREFFADLTTNPQFTGLAHVSRLDVGEVFAAANLGLMFRGGYYHVLASYDDGPLSRFGPGAAHLHELMRYALEHRCTLFDFTIGDEPYKRDWSDTELKLYDYVEAATWRGAIAAGTVAVGQRAKRAIKQSERLWPLVMRLRASFGSFRSRLGPSDRA